MVATQPLVSAVLVTHNRANLLPRALDSVVVQSYENVEIIVVDDGSVDRTPDLIEEYRQNVAIKYIRLEESVGACQARNRGIREAKGEFVAGLDDDDKWHKDRIKELVAAYSDDFACVTSDTMMVFPGYEAPWKKKKVIDLETLLFTNQVGNQVLARRERLQEVGGFDDALHAAQDYDLWVRLCAAYGPIRNVQFPLQTIYMDHQGERITDNSAFRGYLQFYQKHKQKMNRDQRKYQIYKLRRTQGKPESITEFIRCVPLFRYWKEIKRIVRNKFLG